jgi:hypothetical protein
MPTQPVIDSIETAIVALPIVRSHRLANAIVEMQQSVIVRLRCSDGIDGSGEATSLGGLSYGGDSAESIKVNVDLYLAPVLIGAETRSLGRAVANMARVAPAAVAALPFGILRGFTGTDLPKVNGKIKAITCPFTGELLAAVPAVRPDVAVIHAQKADRKGNVLIWGIIGVQKEAVLAAKRSIVTVEEIVDRLDPPPNACILPGWLVSAICLCPGGAYPSYAQGYYDRDNQFYQSWDKISRSREEFLGWIKMNLSSKSATNDFRGRFRKSIGEVA